MPRTAGIRGLRGSVGAFGLALLSSVALGLVKGGEAVAQEWRTVTKVRHLAGEEHLDVAVGYGAGTLEIRPGSPDLLYRMRLRYDERYFEPTADLSASRLRLGVRSRSGGIRSIKSETGGELELEFGAAKADLELGGLRLTGLDIETGASETRLSFSEPNPMRMRRAHFSVGAASFRARHLANLNAERIQVEAGVGDLHLDFSGRWSGDTELRVDMGLGSLGLRFPEDVGVRVIKDTFFTAFDPEGLTKRGNRYESPNWDEVEHRITVRVDGALGSINVRWIR